MDAQTNRERLMDVLRDAVAEAAYQFEATWNDAAGIQTRDCVAHVAKRAALLVSMRIANRQKVLKALMATQPVAVPTWCGQNMAYVGVSERGVWWVIVRKAHLYARLQSIYARGLLRSMQPVALLDLPWQIQGLGRAALNGLLAWMADAIALVSEATSWADAGT